MEEREDLASILPYLPLILRSSSLFWPSKTLESLKALSLGPDVSRVDAGEVLFDAIIDLRESIGISGQDISPSSADGYALFFDDLMSREDSRIWFGEVLPKLARLLLRLPALLELHYRDADNAGNGLRVMDQQESGIVFLSQELVAALLACAFLCLFPTKERGSRCLPIINFDKLFASLHPNARESQEQKIKCLIHYFERICQCMPTGYVSFERKVLPFEQSSYYISYPETSFWRSSAVSLCPFEALSSGFIEDQRHEALEVDFANEYLGGGALNRGCVQVFLPEPLNRYGSSFRFVGDYVDKRPHDSLGRRKTRIVAIDALCSPRGRQYGVQGLLREANKAYCGFFDCSKNKCYVKMFQETSFFKNHLHQTNTEAFGAADKNHMVTDGTSAECKNPDVVIPCMDQDSNIFGWHTSYDCQEDVGVATGNWGCGAFGGDAEIKSIIQWLAASQALRPFIHYHTFGEAALQRIEEVTQWILLHGWTVGDLWSMLVEYSSQRLNGETNLGFFTWLLPEQSSSTTSDENYMSE